MSHPPLILILMKNAQLSLIIDERPWRLDNTTKQVGREGLARARAALAPHLVRPEDHDLAA